MNKQITLNLPKDIDVHKEYRTVSIDIEIVKSMKHLWKHHIQTLGCCSGHNKVNPSIVISDEYSNRNIKRIKKIISTKDIHEWDIFQWRKGILQRI